MSGIGEVLILRERSTGVWLRVENKKWLKLIFIEGQISNNLTKKQLHFAAVILELNNMS